MITRSVPAMPSPPPYRSSADHLHAELARIELLIRAQVTRWRMTIAASKPERLWGMVHVSDAEVDQYLNGSAAPAGTMPPSLSAALRPYWDAAASAAEAIAGTIASTPPALDLRLVRLTRELGLGAIERDVLLICLLPEIDIRYRRVYGYLRDDATRAKATVDLVLQILAPDVGSLAAGRALFEPSAPLRAKHLVIVTAHDDSRAASSVTIDDRIASFLLDGDNLDARLRGIVTLMPAARIAWDQLFCDDGVRVSLQRLTASACGQTGPAAPGAMPAIVRFHGPHGSGRSEAAQAMCGAIGQLLLHVDVEAALRDPARWELVVDLAYREAALLRAAIYWDGIERLQQEDQPTHRWRYLIVAASAHARLTILADAGGLDASRRFDDSRFPRFDFTAPHYEMRRRIWNALLPLGDAFSDRGADRRAERAADRAAAADALAGAFQLTAGQVRSAVDGAVALARRRDFAHPEPAFADVQEACRRQAGQRLLGFARRIEPTRRLTIDDVILPEATKRQVCELLDRVRLRSRLRAEMGVDEARGRGRGLLVMLAGASGTGKTLSAELVASQEGLDLYKVDLSAVVSKWVGETEKNLHRVFSEAEDSGALLFFDECDSLFGQRGDISEARDRWANLQVNYLLQRVEEYSGVVMMATNLRKNVDDAFVRRIQVVIEFPTPDAELRLHIWDRLLPASRELAEAELREIADRFALTGGSIRNVSVDAAFRALAAGRRAITVRDVVIAAAREYQKLARPITQGEFGAPFYRWVVADVLSPAAARV